MFISKQKMKRYLDFQIAASRHRYLTYSSEAARVRSGDGELVESLCMEGAMENLYRVKVLRELKEHFKI